MFDPYSIIKNILLTEKATEAEKVGKYVFKVSKDATKIDIARAVEAIYNVKVQKVNVLVRKGKPKRMGRRSLKMGRTSDFKRATVTLSEGTIKLI